jgi:hypothetical protein
MGNAAKLEAIFERAMLVALATAAPAALSSACSGGSSGSASGGDAAIDAFVREDAASAKDGSLDGDRDGRDLWGPGCEPGKTVFFDGGGDGPPACEYTIPLPCGLPPWVTHVQPPQCFLDPSDCNAICSYTSGCWIANGFGCDDDAGAFVAPDGSPIRIECDLCPCPAGRRPAGLVAPARRRTADPLGEYLARSAFLEAASVGAFRTLANELRRFGAPETLVRAARRSAREEVRHARTMTRLARARGTAPPRPRITSGPSMRELLDVAVENEREGCVRETFGALVATWQSTRARDRRVAVAMARIAIDETRHAALAWSVSAWMSQRLDRRQRRRVAEARRDAAEALRMEIAGPRNAALIHDAGLPTPRAALALHGQLGAALWAAA